MTAPPRPPSSRLDLPFRGSALGVCCFYGVVSAIAIVAIDYLIHFRTTPVITILASVAWLSLVALLVSSAISDEGGVLQYLVNRLGYFSKRQFIETDKNAEQRPTICFGYELFGRKYYYLQVEATAIKSVYWHHGQGTAMSGRDMNDWSITMRYHHPAGSRWPKALGRGSLDVHTVEGPWGAKERAEAFGHLLVAFLRSAGVELQATDDPTRFVVSEVASPA